MTDLFKVTYSTADGGFLVYRGEEFDRVAVFVDGVEAEDYANYRNSALRASNNTGVLPFSDAPSAVVIGSYDDLNILRQWFNSIHDLNKKQIQACDRELYHRIMNGCAAFNPEWKNTSEKW
ncbi:hypothetical protein [Citrobacter amalonaticus]|uniref:hypothetical protein n=1 Tax=Citrobacter amalonaticus TaxID=35703 RepID=UPI003AAE179F